MSSLPHAATVGAKPCFLLVTLELEHETTFKL